MDKPKHTLLVWEMIPEDTLLFLIPNSAINAQQRADLKLCAGHFEEMYAEHPDGVDEALERVSELLAKGDGSGGAPGGWLQFKTKGESIPYLSDVNVTDVCITGVML